MRAGPPGGGRPQVTDRVPGGRDAVELVLASDVGQERVVEDEASVQAHVDQHQQRHPEQGFAAADEEERRGGEDPSAMNAASIRFFTGRTSAMAPTNGRARLRARGWRWSRPRSAP